MRRFVLPTILATFAWFLSAQTVDAQEVRITLTPAPQYAFAEGKAKYKNIGGERELQIEVEDLRTLRGSSLLVYVKGAFVGRMRINGFGNGRLERNSDLGQHVPVIRPGSKVVIRRPGGGKVFSGTF